MGSFHLNSSTAHFFVLKFLWIHISSLLSILLIMTDPVLSLLSSPHTFGLHTKSCWGALCPTARPLALILSRIIFRSDSWEAPLAIINLLDFILLITTPWPNNTHSCEVYVSFCCIWFCPALQMSLNMRALTSDPVWPSEKYFSVGL